MKPLFSIDGRMTRGAFWIASLVFWALYFGLRPAVTAALQSSLQAEAAATACHAADLAFAVVAVAFFALIGTRRLHDRGASGARWLWLLVPVIGPLLLFYQMALRRGQPDSNRYGPGVGPADFHARLDYLVIR